MSIFSEENYRTLIRQRLREIRSSDRSWSLRRLAAEIPIQYTYLSKALNDEKTHLSEDHLFTVGKVLGLSNDESDYLLCLRALEIAQNPSRQQHLRKKIEAIRRVRELSAQKVMPATEPHRLNAEMRYLFNPLCPIVHAALSIPQILSEPRRLCAELSISLLELNEILGTLSTLNFIEIDKNFSGRVKIKKLLQGHIHYGPEHPLMRAHQQVLRHFCSARLARVDETKKKSMMVTFTANAQAVAKIKQEFNQFMKQAEKIASNAPGEGTYQMNFDLFEWFSY